MSLAPVPSDLLGVRRRRSGSRSPGLVTNPFQHPELLARIASLRKRSARSAKRTRTVDPFLTIARTGAVAQCGTVSGNACSCGLSSISAEGAASSSHREISVAGQKRDTGRRSQAHSTTPVESLIRRGVTGPSLRELDRAIGDQLVGAFGGHANDGAWRMGDGPGGQHPVGQHAHPNTIERGRRASKQPDSGGA
jgi:hypothetical protein